MPTKAKKTTKTKAKAPATLNMLGRRYTKVSCGHTKNDATAAVAKIREKGFGATIKQDENGKYCTYRGKKLKTAIAGTKKKTTARKKK